jgi:hypothetical protein
MLARVATFNSLPQDLDTEALDHLRATIRDTPGVIAGYHLGAPGGKALSIVVFEDEDAARGVRQALEQRPQERRVGIDPDQVEFFEAHPF